MPGKAQREAQRQRIAEANRCRDATGAALTADRRWHRRRDAPGTALAVWQALAIAKDNDTASNMTLAQVAARVVKTRSNAEFNAADMLLTPEGTKKLWYIGGKRNSRLHTHVGSNPVWQLQLLLDNTVGMGDDVPYATIIDLVAARGMKDEMHQNLLAWSHLDTIMALPTGKFAPFLVDMESMLHQQRVMIVHDQLVHMVVTGALLWPGTFAEFQRLTRRRGPRVPKELCWFLCHGSWPTAKDVAPLARMHSLGAAAEPHITKDQCADARMTKRQRRSDSACSPCSPYIERKDTKACDTPKLSAQNSAAEKRKSSNLGAATCVSDKQRRLTEGGKSKTTAERRKLLSANMRPTELSSVRVLFLMLRLTSNAEIALPVALTPACTRVCHRRNYLLSTHACAQSYETRKEI